MNDTYQLKWISAADPLFSQARELRYRVLHQPFGVPKDTDLKDWDPSSFHLTAVSGTKPVGYGRLVMHPDGAQIRHLSVDEAYRGEGIGAQLLDELMEEARRRGAARVFLNARFNALGLYRSRGFTESGGFTHTENTFIPHKRMERAL